MKSVVVSVGGYELCLRREEIWEGRFGSEKVICPLRVVVIVPAGIL